MDEDRERIFSEKTKPEEETLEFQESAMIDLLHFQKQVC
jgi:hypothetical protein